MQKDIRWHQTVQPAYKFSCFCYYGHYKNITGKTFLLYPHAKGQNEQKYLRLRARSPVNIIQGPLKWSTESMHWKIDLPWLISFWHYYNNYFGSMLFLWINFHLIILASLHACTDYPICRSQTPCAGGSMTRLCSNWDSNLGFHSWGVGTPPLS